MFHIRIDDLISDDDVENKHLPDEAKSRTWYRWAMACLIAATVSAAACYFWQSPYLYGLSIAGVVAYMVCGLLSKPKYKRMAARRTLVVPFILSRCILAAVILTVLVCGFVGS